MNEGEKKQIIELLNTVREAIEYSIKSEEEKVIYLSDACTALKSIVDFLKEKMPEYNTESIVEIINILITYLESEDNKESLLAESIGKINVFIQDFEQGNAKKKIKALFLPYKASMWTALEGVWKEADEDPYCEAVVVPIPYHELDDKNNKVQLCYEGERYPSYVPITKFWEYRIEEEKPDMIFIHNPYDDTNTLTRVPEEYYSRNLKKYTNMLTYIPYYTEAFYHEDKLYDKANHIATRYVDKIIVQNDKLKEKYEEYTHNLGKVLPLGSPKIDAIRRLDDNKVSVCYEWKKKISGKKVFLLNTTLIYISTFKEEAISNIINIYNEICKYDDAFLIWRPHPLEKAWIHKIIPEFYDSYIKLLSIFEKSENALIDNTEDYRMAISVSKAMISSTGSLVNEYMATGKPVFLMMDRYEAGKNKVTKGFRYLMDYSTNYYRGSKSINDFISSVISGEEDKLIKNRIEKFNRCIANSEDGGCSKEVYRTLKNEVVNKN